MSGPGKKYVTICGVGEDHDIRLPVEPKSTSPSDVAPTYALPVEALKAFYPNALTVYEECEGVMRGLKTSNGVIEVDNLEVKYIVRLSEESPQASRPQFPQAQAVSSSRKEQIRQMRLNILGSINDNSKDASSKVREKPQRVCDSKKKKFSDLRNAAAGMKIIDQPKTIRIGWKHRYYLTDPFKQMKAPQGGIKNVTLHPNKMYSVKDIIEMAVPLFDSPFAEDRLSKSDIELGCYSSNIVFDSFTNKRGEEIGIFNYFHLHSLKLYSQNLYLLSTSKKEFVAALPSFDSEESEQEDEVGKENSPIKIGQNAKSPVKKKSFAISGLQNTKNSDEVGDENNHPETKTKVFRSPKKVNFSPTSVQPKTKALDLPPTPADSESFPQLEFVAADLSPEELAQPISRTVRDSYNTAQVLYWTLKFSKYSGQAMVSELDEIAVLREIRGDSEIRIMVPDDLSTLNAVDFGYKTSKIIINGNILMSVVVDELAHPDYSFFAADSPKPHSILHDLDEVHGFCNEKYGLGIVVACTEDCNPIFSWFCDNKMLKKAPLHFWLPCLPDSGGVFFCKITCNSESARISKKIRICKSQLSLVKLDLTEPLMIQKNQYSLSTDVIGEGMQGKVFHGTYNNNPVAIKRVQLFTRNTKDIENEIKYLQSVKHPNFVKLIGVCKETRNISLVMEYFASMSLTELIYSEEDVREQFTFNSLRKHSIAVQISSAIAFLQARENPILHRDIKPDNILANEKSQIKVCDFGLSKFSFMITKLRSTVARLKGTIPYMAPELLLRGESASIFSKSWSLACVLLELAQEALVWPDDIDSQEKLVQIMENKVKPDVSKIRSELGMFLSLCFSYDVSERPVARDILENVRKCSFSVQ